MRCATICMRCCVWTPRGALGSGAGEDRQLRSALESLLWEKACSDATSGVPGDAACPALVCQHGAPPLHPHANPLTRHLMIRFSPAILAAHTNCRAAEGAVEGRQPAAAPRPASPTAMLSTHSVPAPRRGGGLTAVLLGAGTAGLLAAHVACQHADAVTLVESDRLESSDSDLLQVCVLLAECACDAPIVPQFAQPHTPCWPCFLPPCLPLTVLLPPQRTRNCRPPGSATASPSMPSPMAWPWEGWRQWRRCCPDSQQRWVAGGALLASACLGPRCVPAHLPSSPRAGAAALAAGLRCTPTCRPACSPPLQLVRRGGLELDFGRDFRLFDFGAPDARGETSLKVVGGWLVGGGWCVCGWVGGGGGQSD